MAIHDRFGQLQVESKDSLRLAAPALPNAAPAVPEVGAPEFAFNGHSIRVVQIAAAPWFVASDACKALGLTNTAKAVAGLPDYQLTLTQIQGQRGLPMRTVSEAGLYSMVMRSDKPEARSFRDWVTGTVLPSIRNTGHGITCPT